MNIFFKELKSNRKSLIFWSIGALFMVASGMAKFSAMGATGQSTNDLLSAMPKALQSILGFGAFDMSKASGYYGMLFIYLAIMAAIHASMLGADIIGKEESLRTSEFLFVKPVSRARVVTEKLLAALVNLVVFNLVTLISSLLIVKKYSHGEPFIHDVSILMLGMFFLQFLFLSIGTALAAISKRPKTATSLVTGIVLSTYIFSVAIDMNDKLEFLKYLTPFKYFDAKNLMNGGGFDFIFVALAVIIVAMSLIATYVFYDKRDLNT